jgi:hemerythrin
MKLTLPHLPVAFMNEDHAHAEALWRDMRAALSEEPADMDRFVTAFRAFLEHNRAHFAREEEAMQRFAFPPYPVHKAEHDRILAQLADLLAAAEAGKGSEQFSRAIEHDIPAWLQQHVQSMDLVTARWIAAHA